MGTKDPEGAQDKSRQEKQDALDKSSREFKGEPEPKNSNPEGVPEGDR